MKYRRLFIGIVLSLTACETGLFPPTPTATAAATLTPTATPTPSPTPTPTPLPHPAAFDAAFAHGLIRFEPARGEWLATVVQTADGGLQTADDGPQAVEMRLLADTFDTHDALRAKNPLAPYTVKALDKNGQEVTLIWRPDTAEFRVAYTFPTLFEGVGTENPRLIEENLDAIPFIPIQDIQSGLAAQSVLLAMQESGYQPFSEEAAKAYAKLGGYSLLFELKNGFKTADLKSWVNWTRSADYPNDGKGINYNTVSMKSSPYWIRTAINGQTYDVPALVLLNPQDAQNPQPDEFLVVFAIPHDFEVMDASSLTSAYALKNPLIPSCIHLFAQRQDGAPLDPQSPNLLESLLAQLLSIEGNDVRNLLSSDPNALYFPSAMTYIDDLGKVELGYGNTIEMPFPSGVRIPFEIQTMGPFPVEIGVAESNP